jgi:putative effector of murein hydrolase
MLMVTGTPFQRYFAGAQFVHFLLGPATVALAVPLWEHRARVRAALVPMALALLFGVTTAIVSTVLMARALQLPDDLVLALAPKSATAPIAMGVAQTLGAEPALTAILVITTGVVGAIVVTPLMNALRLTDWAARGFAAGLASHGIGTARAFQVHPLAGTFAGIAIGLSGLATALLAPLIVPLLMR